MSKKELQKLQSDLEALIKNDKLVDLFIQLLKYDLFKLPILSQFKNEFLEKGSTDSLRQKMTVFIHAQILEEMENAPDAVEEMPAPQDICKGDLESELAYLQSEIEKAKGVLVSLQNEIEEAKNSLAYQQNEGQNLSVISSENKGKAMDLFRKGEVAQKTLDKIEAYKEAIQYYPDYIDAYYKVAYWYNSIRDYKNSLLYFDKVIELNYNYKDVLLTVADINLGLNLYKEAIEYYEKYINIKNDNFIPYYSISRSYSILREKKKTLEYLSKAMICNPSIKFNAKKREEFDWLQNDEEFKKLVE